jgi:hypothetical protein
MDTVQKHISSNYHSPSSEPYRVYLNNQYGPGIYPTFRKWIQVLWTLGRWTQSKSTFFLIIILHRQNPTEFIWTTSMDLVYILPSESDIQVLCNPGRWTQSKNTFILITILLRQNPIEFTCHNVANHPEFCLGWLLFNVTFTGNAGCFKNNFTVVFQMLLCGECYENVYTLKAYKLSFVEQLERNRTSEIYYICVYTHTHTRARVYIYTGSSTFNLCDLRPRKFNFFVIPFLLQSVPVK